MTAGLSFARVLSCAGLSASRRTLLCLVVAMVVVLHTLRAIIYTCGDEKGISAWQKTHATLRKYTAVLYFGAKADLHSAEQYEGGNGERPVCSPSL